LGSDLTSIIISSGVNIQMRAFGSCNYLINLTIANDVQLGAAAFAVCAKLNKITFLNLKANPTYTGTNIFFTTGQRKAGTIDLQNCNLTEEQKNDFLTYLSGQGLTN
jgi:hypothetical protein